MRSIGQSGQTPADTHVIQTKLLTPDAGLPEQRAPPDQRRSGTSRFIM
jgi:hypothetical protein